MFWINTIKDMKELGLARYKATQNRINKISDYIQGPLAELIEKASKEAIKDYFSLTKNENKKDK